MDAEEICILRVCVIGKGSAGDDENGAVDEKRKSKEGYCEFGDREGEARADGGDGGLVLCCGVGGVVGGGCRWGGDVAVLFVVVVEARLNEAAAEIEAVWHYSCAEDAAGLIESDCVSAMEDKLALESTYPCPSMRTEDGRNPRNTVPALGILTKESSMQKQMTTLRTSSPTKTSKIRIPRKEPFGR